MWGAPKSETVARGDSYRSLKIHCARSRNGFRMGLPVKQKRALLASNPLRSSRSELIANDGPGLCFPACPKPWHRPDREAG